jgi:hypothetical protein
MASTRHFPAVIVADENSHIVARFDPTIEDDEGTLPKPLVDVSIYATGEEWQSVASLYLSPEAARSLVTALMDALTAAGQAAEVAS